VPSNERVHRGGQVLCKNAVLVVTVDLDTKVTDKCTAVVALCFSSLKAVLARLNFAMIWGQGGMDMEGGYAPPMGLQDLVQERFGKNWSLEEGQWRGRRALALRVVRTAFCPP
jgi:hypothetical protein